MSNESGVYSLLIYEKSMETACFEILKPLQAQLLFIINVAYSS